eukprot:scaffold10113_cov150-Isochrysis_galbana.AAC.3
MSVRSMRVCFLALVLVPVLAGGAGRSGVWCLRGLAVRIRTYMPTPPVHMHLHLHICENENQTAERAALMPNAPAGLGLGLYWLYFQGAAAVSCE